MNSSRITKKVPTCSSDQKIGEVRDELIRIAKKLRTIDYVYVLSKKNKLKGVISIHELLSFSPDKLIKDCMSTKLVKAHKEVDKEKIARLAISNSIKAIPIIDKNNYFLGVVRADEILRILDAEAHEDLMLIEGIIPPNAFNKDKDSIFNDFIHRVPWIIVGLFGGLGAARIIAFFEGVLQKEMLLAAFIPLVVYLANAVGSQTQTLYIRDLALNKKIFIVKYGLNQLFISFFIGISCWLCIGLVASLFWHSNLLGFIVGFAVFCSIITATSFALLVPFLLLKVKKDPAIGSGPFTTVIQDIFSVLIYFLIATILV